MNCIYLRVRISGFSLFYESRSCKDQANQSQVIISTARQKITYTNFTTTTCFSGGGNDGT
jgi:hypothetical protein